MLGISRDADTSEIKKAYRKLAMKYHPDRNQGDSTAEENFKEAAEAYSVLADSQKRAGYDRFGHAGLSGVGAGGFGGFNSDIFSEFEDILGDLFGFGDLFGRRGGRRTRSAARTGNDLRYALDITLEEAYTGISRKIKFRRRETCQRCKGSCAEPGVGTVPCSTCRGLGEVQYSQGFLHVRQPCPSCHGAGKMVKEKCRDCGGAGLLDGERRMTIIVPAGVETGQRLRITGEGEGGVHGGPPGDLYVDLSVQEHELFQRDSEHLILQMPVSFSQAALGGEISIPTINGKKKLKIPAGTQSGAHFRLKGLGLPVVNGHRKGSLYVIINVKTPATLSKAQKDLFKQIDLLDREEYSPGKDDKNLLDRLKELFK